jgi:hypothetical protein
LESLDFRSLWNEGETFDRFVETSAEKHRELWKSIYRLARVPAWALQALPAGARFRLLIIAEDWCGDAVNIVPLIAKWADAGSGVELRIIRRDEYPAVMDRYLTNGSRSIPIVIVLDDAFREVGHWGPRPTELQAWVRANQPRLPKEEFYPEVRRWYAQDRGESTLRELLEVMGAHIGVNSER